MDEVLLEIISLASGRGSKYVKGDVSLDELPQKLAEFGILLLSTVNSIEELRGGRLKEELIDIQNKLDDLRKNIFYLKFQVVDKAPSPAGNPDSL